MFISSALELNSYFPTSTLEKIYDIMPMIERAEEAHVRPILGGSLYEFLSSKYKECLSMYSGITSNAMEDSEVTPVVRLLRLCQSASVMFAISDNIGILSVSMNMGAGFSVVETDGYSPADEKTKERLQKDLYHNAWRDIDNMLLMLENDAKSKEPLFADLWHDSDYFYYQGDVLISTAKEAKRYAGSDMQPYSYREYVNMLADMRFVQQTYIAPELTLELTDALVCSQTSNAPMQKTVEYLKSMGEIGSEKDVVRAWQQCLSLLRPALFFATRYRMTGKDSFANDANLSFMQAKRFITEQKKYFMPYVEYAPFLPKKKLTPNPKFHDLSAPSAFDALFTPFK